MALGVTVDRDWVGKVDPSDVGVHKAVRDDIDYIARDQQPTAEDTLRRDRRGILADQRQVSLRVMRRRGYYQPGRVDAIVMRLRPGASPLIGSLA